MSHLLSNVLPVALGSAVSPTMLALALLVLSGGSHPRARCTAYAAGAALVLIVVGLLALFVFDRTVAPDSGGSHSSPSALVDLAIGLVLIALGLRLTRSRTDKRERGPRTAPTGTKLGRFFALGLGGMLVNFTTLALFLDGTKEIARADITTGAELAALAFVIFVPMLPVLVPLTLYSVAPRRAASILAPVDGFAERHSRTIAIAMTLGFGVYLIVKGALALASTGA